MSYKMIPPIGHHLGFYPKLEIIKQWRRLKILGVRRVKYDTLLLFVNNLCFFSPKKEKKYTFSPNNVLITCYLASASNQSYVKMYLRDMHTTTENGRC